MTALFDQIAAAGFLDWLALLTSLAYVWLAARDNNWCWAFAAVSTAVWAYQSFVEYQLVSDGMLQVFYFIMAGVGLWRWRGRGSKASPEEQGTGGEKCPISRMPLREHLLVIGGSMAGAALLYFFVSGNFTAAATLPDAVTTVFSVTTTFLLIGRRLENWLYWIVIDIAYVWIYASTGAILFAVMMVVNVGMALYGYRNWQREMTGTANLFDEGGLVKR